MAPSIPSATLNTGTKIPILGYGSGTAWYAAPDAPLDRRLVDALVTAQKLGYRHLDCAETYNNEREMGVAIKEGGVPREELFVTTKLWPSVKDPKGTFARSLERLQADYIDLYLLHCPFFNEESHGTTVAKVWAEIEEIHASGKARDIGVSNFNVEQLQELLKTAKVVPATNQIELHPYCYDVELEKFCKERGIVLTSYGPLSPIVRFAGGPLDPVLEKIAERHGKSQAQVLLKWGTQKGFVLATTTSKEERMKEFLDLEGWRLTDEEIEEIDTVGLTHHKRAYWPKEYGEK